MQDAVWIVDLVDRRRPFSTQSPAAGRMDRIALELANLAGGLIDESQQSAGRLAIEAGRGDERIMPLDAIARPAVSFYFDPVVPLFGRRRAGEHAVAIAVMMRTLINQPERDRSFFNPTQAVSHV